MHGAAWLATVACLQAAIGLCHLPIQTNIASLLFTLTGEALVGTLLCGDWIQWFISPGRTPSLLPDQRRSLGFSGSFAWLLIT